MNRKLQGVKNDSFWVFLIFCRCKEKFGVQYKALALVEEQEKQPKYPFMYVYLCTEPNRELLVLINFLRLWLN